MRDIPGLWDIHMVQKREARILTLAREIIYLLTGYIERRTGIKLRAPG